MKNDNVIEISNLKKKYKLGTIGGGTLRGEIQSRIALWRGKEDPNAMIGSQNTYGKEFWALNGLDLEVKRGERIGIIGHNGAGKSTLLKLLSRITAPTEGEIQIKGRISSMLEVGTGFHGELTGRENIYLNAAILGMNNAEVDAKIDDIIAFSECEDFIDTPVKRYSSGMFVKLAFAVAAHLDSEILIMDEDMQFQEKCLNKMNEIAEQENRTILYVSHNMNTIKKLCDRCIVLDHGKKIYDGDVDTAMTIYLDNEQKLGNDNVFDLQPQLPGETARFISFTMLNTEDCVFEQGDDIEVKVGIRCYEKLEDVHVRVLIKYMDTSILGTYFSEKFTIEADNDYQMNFRIPLRVVPEGEFYIRTVLSKGTPVGTWVDQASVEKAAIITMKHSEQNYLGMNWERGWRTNLGTLRIDTMNIV